MKLVAMITANNFKLELEKSKILPYQEFLIFVKR
jgi:hypothetical protein